MSIVKLTDFCRGLLASELEKRNQLFGVKSKPVVPSRSFVRRLFNNYLCEEFDEVFYDSEPELDDEELRMHYDYCRPEVGHKMSKFEHTNEELREAFEKVREAYEKYEQRRLTFNNWIDPNFAGCWSFTQEEVDRWAKECMSSVKNTKPGYKGRMFMWQKDNYIYVYYFGRDIRGVDYLWCLEKRARKKR